MNADDRILLLDLENLGTVRLRPRPLRARLETLLAAAGEIHHAVAAYALSAEETSDPLASLLAELRIAPLRVPTGTDAAELALLAPARHVHDSPGVTSPRRTLQRNLSSSAAMLMKHSDRHRCCARRTSGRQPTG